MEPILWLIGGDSRQLWAARELTSQGWQVHTHDVPGASSEPLPQALSIILLPFPSVAGALIRGHSGVPMEEVLCRLVPGSRVFGGLLGDWKASIAKKQALAYDLYGAEPFTTGNAAITAEGALQLAMEQSPFTLFGASCLILGFGRIGKLLARKLQALGARVTVAARKAADHGLILAAGYAFESISFENRMNYDFVFNTVPTPLLTEAHLRSLPSHCLLVELASSPGGFAPSVCEALGLRLCSGAGLPGKCAPASAGRLYAQTVLSILNQEDRL